MEARYPEHSGRRWHANKINILGIKVKIPPTPAIIPSQTNEIIQSEVCIATVNILNVADRNYEKEIIRQKYKYIDEVVEEVLFQIPPTPAIIPSQTNEIIQSEVCIAKSPS